MTDIFGGPPNPRSVFNNDGDIRPGGGNMQVGDYVDVREVNWPTFKGYDFDHGRHTAQLVRHLASLNTNSGGLGVIDEPDVRILEAAALLHDIGRTKEGDDPDHYRRGAILANGILAGPGNNWTPEDRDAVSRLILRHGDRDAARGNALLQILQDADRLEVGRFDVQTKAGLARIAQSCRRELFWTPWAADAGTLRKWLKFHKWQV
jgi:hypothetical protein